MTDRWTMLDTFSGIGGFSLAARWTGRIETVQFVEIDPFCRRVLAKNFPGVPIHDDIRTYSSAQFRDAADRHATLLRRAAQFGDQPHADVRVDGAQPALDLLTGGFPCQPWSAAGKQRGTDDDRDLWPELARLVATLRPRWCLFENVPGIVNMAGGLERVWAHLEADGYGVGAVVVPAAAVGAPHKRERVWIVAHAEGADGQGGVAHRHARGICGLTDRGAPADPAPRGLRRGSAPPDGAGRREHSGTVDLRAQLAPDQRGGGGPRAQAPGAQSPLGLPADGLPRRLDGESPRGPAGSVDAPLEFGPDWEHGVPRVTLRGNPYRVRQLKALGNAIVPQVAYELMQMILVADR